MPDRAESTTWGQKARYGEFEIVGAREAKPRVLGEGSFGKTFEGVRTDTVAGGIIEEHVAIKVLNPTLLISESRRLQVVQELVALTKFKHSNLIHYIRCGEDEGEVFYAMELCRGGDLARLVRRYRVLPEKVAALIGLQVATGLREVHQRHRLVHRDIKPSNIMLVDELESGLGVTQLAERLEEQEGLCRIVDFGLVSFALNMKEAHERFVGSPMYASPEQINEQPLDGRSDIYSLGMTLWYLVQGKGPLLDAHGNDLKGVREAMRRHALPEEHRAHLPPHLSEDFRNILAKMVAKRPEDRYATAAEVQQALRDYLRTGSSLGEAKFSATIVPGSLADLFTIEENLETRNPYPSRIARRTSNGERVKLTTVPRAIGQADVEIRTQQLCNLAELTRHPARPGAFLHVQEVIRAADGLAFTEDLPPHLTLAEVVKAHYQTGQTIPFSEAMSVLRPIAEALDFLIEHGHGTVSLFGEEVWMTASAADTGSAALDPLTPLTDLQAHFSIMHLPQAPAGGDAISSMQETLSASMQPVEMVLHPVPAFARIVYVVMTGGEVPAASQYTPAAYVPSANLRPASNEILRNILCQQDVWTHATTVLRNLCAHEGVVWQNTPFGYSTQRTTGSAGTSPTDAGSNPSFRSGPGSGAASTGSESWQRDMAGREKVCEIAGPGLVYSPYDPERRTQVLSPEQWVPSGRVRCQITQRMFRLPRKLDLLCARVIAPGIIQSPYAAPDVPQIVPWEDWIGGGEIVCAESGRRIVLPYNLPTPDAILLPHRPGMVISPFDRVTAIEIPPDRWEAGATVQCPATQSRFLLPQELPPLEAIADAGRPGRLSSPYAPNAAWEIEPPEWTAGKVVQCPVSGKQLRLPQIVEQWAAESHLVDAARRLISNPFQPNTTLQVPASAWTPRAAMSCPKTGRTILLPSDLPLLVADIIDGRPGVVRSPYGGQVVSVAPHDWLPGMSLTCSQTHLPFLLPAELPDWIPMINVSESAPGRVRSPYEPFPEIQVAAEEWSPGQVLECPETGRRFRLPMELPLLEGKVKQGVAGKVTSPFSHAIQDVALDDWKPGEKLECEKTGRTFCLPTDLPEWLPDADWVPGCPGRVRSPFFPHPEMDLTTEQWRSAQILSCPETHRRFRLPPAAPFPTLALEKQAVQYALAEPHATEAEAADALGRLHNGANAEMVLAIWQRHELETAEKRWRHVQIGEVFASEPGFARSPYGSRPKVEVAPAVWADPRASVICPETGRRFLLPADRPALFARLVPGQLGRLISPYRPDEPFPILPEQWQPGATIRCEQTGHLLQLPPDLPEWLPEGTLKEEQPGIVFSPYGRFGAVPVPGAQWYAGANVTCLETGRVFILPQGLPPLTATVDKHRLGFVASPYSRESLLRIPHRQWKAGAALICPQTKRVFLLPGDLPEWKQRPFPWKLAAAAGGVVAIVAGALLSWSLFGKAASPQSPSTGKTASQQGMLAPALDFSSGNSDQLQTPAVPQTRRVTFAGGLDIEDWPQKNELPKGLRLIRRGKEVPLKLENSQWTATLPAESDESASAEVELRVAGWTPLKFDLPKPAENKLFDTKSTSILPWAPEFSTPVSGDVVIADRKRMERRRVSLPSSIIPDGGTDYTWLEASWVGRLSHEPDSVAPPSNPVKLQINKGQIERPLPTGIYDFTLRGASSDKVEIAPVIWKAGVPLSAQSVPSLALPPSVSGDLMGLLFTVKTRSEGYVCQLSIAPKLASIRAMVAPLPLKAGEVIGFDAVKPEKDQLAAVENVKLSDPRTLEFDAALKVLNYHWTMKVEEDGKRFLYGNLIELKNSDFAREKVRMEQMFRDKARSSRVSPLGADWLGGLPLEQFRAFNEESLKEARQTAQYLKENYPEMRVKNSSIYSGLHPSGEVVRVIRLNNGDLDFQGSAH